MVKATIKMLEEKLDSAKDDLEGAKARIVWLEAKIGKDMQTNDRRTPTEVTALESTPVVEAPPPPVVTGPESAPVVPRPPAPTAPQSECDDEACRRHKQKPDSCVEPE